MLLKFQGGYQNNNDSQLHINPSLPPTYLPTTINQDLKKNKEHELKENDQQRRLNLKFYQRKIFFLILIALILVFLPLLTINLYYLFSNLFF